MNLKPLDLLFLGAENETAPQHVMALTILQPPQGGSEKFVNSLYQDMLASNQAKAPFNYVVEMSLAHMPRYKEVQHLDMSHHIRLARLAAPGNRQQLNELAAEINMICLDRTRPLWEIWLIDGLEDGNVAMVVKMHHALSDGQGMIALATRGFATDAEASLPMFWTAENKKPVKLKKKVKPTAIAQLSKLPKLATKQITNSIGVSRIMQKMGKDLVSSEKSFLPAPFITVGRSPFNYVKPSRQRTIVTSKIACDRVKTISEVTESSTNDVVLTICDIALQQYLKQGNYNYNHPLSVMMPVSLRREGDTSSSNASIGSVVEMGEVNDSPLLRLLKIRRGTQAVKSETSQGTEQQRDAFYSFSMMLMGAYVSANLLKLEKKLAPSANLTISNVPGPREKLFLRGAEMVETYPISIISDATVMNITLNRYDQDYYFGAVTCPAAIPNFDKFDFYLHEALDQLEAELTLALEQVQPETDLDVEEKAIA